MSRGDIEVDGLVRLVLLLGALNHQGGLHDVRTGDEEEAVSVDMSDGIEDRDLMNTDGFGHFRFSREGGATRCSGIEPQLNGGADGCYFLEIQQAALAHHSNTQGLLCHLAAGSDIEEPFAGERVATDLQGHALGFHVPDFLRDGFGLGFVFAGGFAGGSRFPGRAGRGGSIRIAKSGGFIKIFFLRSREHSFVFFPFLGREDEGATAAVLRGGCGNHVLAAHQPQGSLAHLSFRGRCLKSHTAGHSCHQVTSLGEEGEAQLRSLGLGLEVAAQGTEGHVAVVVARFLGFVVDGEDAGVQLFVVTEEILGHRFVVEPVFGGPGVIVFRLAPVELPAGVGTQLEVAAVE